MKKEKNRKKVCTETLSLLGDYWTLAILSALGDDELRFCELQRALLMVNPVTLTNRLQLLQEKGLLHRRVGAVDEVSVSYSLTALGKESRVVIEALHAFSKKFNSKQHSKQP